ncbi:response regulator transcription factor [Streptomyces maremycinicus]|uniref:response regulator transcription factor n=1 Tax=Streptomyces maremycinicus TaxID=1679753 RepID=UPI000789664B|nr:response regulator transcription factor [Streptomyces sp. NBRC 110468]
MTIRVLLADDQALLRGMLRRLVDNTPGMDVAGEAADGAEAVELVRARGADVVLMDIRMPGTDGIEATRAITADPALADVKVLILTTFEIDEYVAEAVRAGARGFIGKGADPEELLAAIETVAAGEPMLSAAATAALMARFQAHAPRHWAKETERLAELTPREREVLVLVASGLTNDGISQRLRLSRHTVKTHVNRAMTKIGVSERAQLVTLAYESGLVEPGEML